MNFRLFIDECLSLELAEMAKAAGFSESTCSRDRGQLGLSDRLLVDLVASGDYTLVTHNARDFRGGGARNPGGLYSQQAIHAGLVCLSSCYPMNLARQRELFGYVLQELHHTPDLVNQALEIFESETGEIVMTVYAIPAKGG